MSIIQRDRIGWFGHVMRMDPGRPIVAIIVEEQGADALKISTLYNVTGSH